MPGKGNHQLCVPIEYIIKALIHGGLSKMVSDSINWLNDVIGDYNIDYIANIEDEISKVNTSDD